MIRQDWWWYDDESPYSPVISGGLVATTRSWWQESGGFDPGMHGWGPLAIWCYLFGAVCPCLLNRETHQFKFCSNSAMPWRLTLSSLAHAHVTVTRSNVEIHPSWARSVGCLSRATGNAASTLVPASYCSWPSQSWDSSEVQHSTRTWTLDISIYILICYLKTNKDVKGC